MERGEVEFLRGTVEYITFQNAITGFTVIRLDDGSDGMVAVGKMPNISVGEQVELIGQYTFHSTYGRQFKVLHCEKILPSGIVALCKYLASGAVKGIGPKTARKIVEQFGEETAEVLESQPERLCTIKGISYERAVEIANQFSGHKSIRDIIFSLSPYGITPDEAVEIHKTLGTDSVEKVKENPYLLCCDSIGLDFQRVDEIADGLEIVKDCDQRICAGIMYVLHHNLGNGHTCIPREKIVEISAKMLDCNTVKVDDCCEILVKEEQIAAENLGGTEFLFLKQYYDSERYISERVKIMMRFMTDAKEVEENEIDKIGQQLGIEFDEIQRLAIEQSISEQSVILTGGPGTGKTTTVNGIIKIMENRGLKIALAAPTGRAAQRLTELTGMEAKTIHRLLEVGTSDDGKSHIYVRNEKNPLDYDALIIDEMSMVDALLFENLLRAVRFNCRLILVGDADQLPSVGAGNILCDLIKSGIVPVIKLEKIFRQAEKSLIVVNAHNIINGKPIVLDGKDSDFFFIEQNNPLKVVSLVNDLFSRRLPEAYGLNSVEDIQVLCPSKMMESGTLNINNVLQRQLNPSGDDIPEVAFKGFVLRRGDKVMQIKNNYDIVWENDKGECGTGVFNGDVGILTEVNLKEGSVKVAFGNKVAEYFGEEVRQLELAYATTIHKSQGSEFDCVILPISEFPNKLCYRNLLYTAVTRAKKLLIVVGRKDMLKQMAKNDRKTLRYTALAEFLVQEDE